MRKEPTQRFGRLELSSSVSLLSLSLHHLLRFLHCLCVCVALKLCSFGAMNDRMNEDEMKERMNEMMDDDE